MLSSIPPIQPLTDAHDLWFNTTSSYSHQPPQTQNPYNDEPSYQLQRPTSRHSPSARNPLSILRADEAAIQIRKLNIRRFGAGWLRPPGVAKTLQAMDDEKQEREEQEAQAQRDQAFAEAQALEAEARDDLTLPLDNEEALERDLDDEIPDADAADEQATSPLSASTADSASEWADEVDVEDTLPGEEGDGDYASPAAPSGQHIPAPPRPGQPRLDFLQEGMGLSGMRGPETPGRQGAASVASQDDALGMMESGRDLDEDVPDAGSYQHTDTDLEESSSGEESEWGVQAGRGGGGQSISVGGAMAAAAQAVGLGSSVFGSSPVAPPRGLRRSSGRGGGVVRRGMGREN